MEQDFLNLNDDNRSLKEFYKINSKTFFSNTEYINNFNFVSTILDSIDEDFQSLDFNPNPTDSTLVDLDFFY
jgi:hypothetical protein